MFAGKKSAQIREILISESAWEEMTCLFAPSLVLLLVSVAILLLTGGHFAQDINFISSPNPGYQSGLAMLSFVVFAIFAYGGIEAVGGLVE